MAWYLWQDYAMPMTTILSSHLFNEPELGDGCDFFLFHIECLWRVQTTVHRQQQLGQALQTALKNRHSTTVTHPCVEKVIKQHLF